VRVYVCARLRAAEPTCASDRDGEKKKIERERERENAREEAEELSSEPGRYCVQRARRGVFRRYER